MTRKKTAVAVIGALFLLAAAVAVWFFIQSGKEEGAKGVVGVVSDDWDPGIEVDPEDASRGIQIPGYGTAQMEAGDTSLRLSVGNPKDNTCGFYAVLRLEDGTVLYESELLEPGQGLTEIPLKQTLESGTYEAAVVYECVTLDEDHTPLNSAESVFTLTVK